MTSAKTLTELGTKQKTMIYLPAFRWLFKTISVFLCKANGDTEIEKQKEEAKDENKKRNRKNEKKGSEKEAKEEEEAAPLSPSRLEVFSCQSFGHEAFPNPCTLLPTQENNEDE